MRYFLRDLPLPSHPFAAKAAEAARCAGEQGQLWEMHGKLLENYRAMQPEKLPDYASELGLDRTAFESCLASGRQAEGVKTDQADAARAGIRSTPSFLLALTPEDLSRVKVVQQVRGAQPFGNFKAALDELLASRGEPSGGGAVP